MNVLVHGTLSPIYQNTELFQSYCYTLMFYEEGVRRYIVLSDVYFIWLFVLNLLLFACQLGLTAGFVQIMPLL